MTQKASERKEIDDTLRKIASEINEAARQGEFDSEYEYKPGSRDSVVLDLNLEEGKCIIEQRYPFDDQLTQLLEIYNDYKE